jgi:hypothetical protein
VAFEAHHCCLACHIPQHAASRCLQTPPSMPRPCCCSWQQHCGKSSESACSERVSSWPGPLILLTPSQLQSSWQMSVCASTPKLPCSCCSRQLLLGSLTKRYLGAVTAAAAAAAVRQLAVPAVAAVLTALPVAAAMMAASLGAAAGTARVSRDSLGTGVKATSCLQPWSWLLLCCNPPPQAYLQAVVGWKRGGAAV